MIAENTTYALGCEHCPARLCGPSGAVRWFAHAEDAIDAGAKAGWLTERGYDHRCPACRQAADELASGQAQGRWEMIETYGQGIGDRAGWAAMTSHGKTRKSDSPVELLAKLLAVEELDREMAISWRCE